MDQSLWNSVGVLFVGGVLTFGMSAFWFARNSAVKKADAIAAEQVVLLARVAELEAKERLSAQVVTPIVTAFQALLVKQLTHAATPELDGLLVKVGPPNVLTGAEHARMMVLLEERTRDHDPEITASERDAAAIFPVVMKMAATEQANMSTLDSAPTFKLATVVSVIGTPPDAAGPAQSSPKVEVDQ